MLVGLALIHELRPGQRTAKARTCRTLKIYLLIAWAFILTGLALAIIAVAEYLEKLSPAFSGLAAAATGFCAASLAATLLRAIQRETREAPPELVARGVAFEAGARGRGEARCGARARGKGVGAVSV